MIEAKLDAALRRLGDNPTQVEAGLERRDQAAEASAKALAFRSVSLGLIAMLICGAIGAAFGPHVRIVYVSAAAHRLGFGGRGCSTGKDGAFRTRNNRVPE